MITTEYNNEINKFASKDEFDKHQIICITFSRTQLLNLIQQNYEISDYIKKIPPAFSLGLVLPPFGNWIPHKGLPLGVIAIESDFRDIFTRDELRFILAHEFSHIILNHSPLNAMGYIGKRLMDDFIKSIEDEFWREAFSYGYEFINLITKINFQKNFEFEADRHASSLIGSRKIAKEAIKKLADTYCEGNLNCPSHIITEDSTAIPIVTFKERLEAI